MINSILDLQSYISCLKPAMKKKFERIFSVDQVAGKFADSPQSDAVLIKFFGKLEGYKVQNIVKVFNQITCEGTLFNSIRAERPIKISLDPKALQEAFEAAVRDFEFVPEDVFGTVKGQYCSTSANIAKYDAVHSLIIFDRDNPLEFSRAEIKDYFATARHWYDQAHASIPEALYPLFIWNCLWKSGGSIVHGHAQILLATVQHFAKIEYLRRCTAHYRQRYQSDYFDDLFAVHESLGLGLRRGKSQVMVYLCPIKEKEILITAPQIDDEVIDLLYDTLNIYVNKLGVRSFNLSMALPPLAGTKESWKGFPVVIRLVDRGNPLSRISDVGAMELYAASVVSSDPWKVADEIFHQLGD